MSRYNIGMIDDQAFTVGPNQGAAHTIPVEITVSDPELWDRAVDKAHDEGATIDKVIESLLQEYIGDDAGPPPRPVR